MPVVDGNTDYIKWDALATLKKFTAADERDTMHILHPYRARLVDLASRRGYKMPKGLLPHISADEMVSVNFDPFSVKDYPGNLLTTAGLTRILNLMNAGGGQAWVNGHAAIGAGDTATTATTADTDLGASQLSGNRWIQVCDSTYPSVSGAVMTAQATFPTGNGNFAWQEWAIFQNTTSVSTGGTAAMLNHKIVSLGTKTSSASWALNVTITLS